MSVQISRRRVLKLSAMAVALAAVGCQPAPAPTKEAAPAAAGASKLFIAADMVWGSKNLPADQRFRSCNLTSRFPRNAEMVWRIRVSDPVSGELLGKEALSKVEVKLSNGQLLTAQFGPHPKDPPNETFWTTSWVIPKDHPTGTLEYSITATDAKGRTGDWKPFITRTSLPTVTDEVLPDAPSKA